MTTIKEKLKNVLVNITNESLEYYSVLVIKRELLGEIKRTEIKAYKGNSNHKLLECEEICGVILNLLVNSIIINNLRRN